MIFAASLRPEAYGSDGMVSEAVISAPSHAHAVAILQRRCNELAQEAQVRAPGAREDYVWSTVSDLTPAGILLASYDMGADLPEPPPGYRYEGATLVRI